VDAKRLRQVLLNLLGNAVKFTAHGAVSLHLRTIANGARLRFEVTDTGPGIPIGFRDRLFEKFERLATAATPGQEGAGVGLAISTQLAALMGGLLGQENRNVGGSVFWLELPLVLSTSIAQPLEKDSVPQIQEPTMTTGLHVLVVDDLDMNREVAAAFLRRGGVQSTCVESGAAAIAAVAASDFDVVLMDIRMPEMDGLEATRRIRALAGPRGEVPIVALTAQSLGEQVAACYAIGMNGHLAKPFDPHQLLTAVHRHVKARPRHDQQVIHVMSDGARVD